MLSQNLLLKNGLVLLRFLPITQGIPPIACRLASRYSRHRDHDDSEDDLPRITCPKKILDKLEHREKKLFADSYKIRRNPKSSLLISCKRKSYNFYEGDHFDEHDAHKLVSFGWKNNKHIGDEFTLIPHSDNPSLQREDDVHSFRELGINEILCAGLLDLGFKNPTAIQKYAIPSLLRGNNVICAAETGSGKTLAYLLPSIERILHQKKAFPSSFTADAMTPKTIILTPNRELSHQILNAAKSLTQYAEFTPQCISGGDHISESFKQLETDPLDILITTPGMLKKLLRKNRFQSKNLQHLIIDESDTLLDDSFILDMKNIFQLLQVSPAEGTDSNGLLAGIQIVLVSATMPRNIEQALGSILPTNSMVKITTQGLHRLQPHVAQKFVRINPDRKQERLIQLVKESAEKNEVMLVFAKNNKVCFYLAKLLEENGIDCLRMSGEMSSRERSGVFQKFKEGYSNTLVATDIASRGLDTTNVCHVINYDFPSFISDYIHRVGRVGRVGVKNTGHVTSFVTYKWDVDLLWQIETAIRKRKRLDNVNANIKRLLTDSKPQKNDGFEINILD